MPGEEEEEEEEGNSSLIRGTVRVPWPMMTNFNKVALGISLAASTMTKIYFHDNPKT